MRFYPINITPFDGEPTHEKFKVRHMGDSRELGVDALVPFHVGELVARFTGFLVWERTAYTIRIAPDSHVHDPYFMCRILHSCEPNMWCDVSARAFYAIRPISPGESITFDYEQTEDVLAAPFVCRCGSPTCRGYIQGHAAKQPAPNGKPSLIREG